MKTLCLRLLLLPIVFLVLFLATAHAIANGGGVLRARLTGYQEVPAISTTGGGTFRARIDDGNSLIHYELRYTTETAASQSHIHLGQRGVNGGVSAFLCGGGDKPPCPGTGGTVTGVIDPPDIIGPNGQGLEPGNFAELARAMRAGVTYANVHTTRFPGGEVRGQIKDQDEDDDHGRD